MNTAFRFLAVALLTLSLGACTSTRFVSVWQAPDAVFGKLNGQKIAAFLISDNESSRRTVESALARELTARGGQGIPGYELLSTESAKDEAVAQHELEKAGVEAVITLRIVSEEQRTTFTPDTWIQVPTYRNLRGYWVQSWRTVYLPGQARQDTILSVETLIYSMGSGAPIWAGLSNTTNPANLDAFVKELASAVDNAMKKSRLIG